MCLIISNKLWCFADEATYSLVLNHFICVSVCFSVSIIVTTIKFDTVVLPEEALGESCKQDLDILDGPS